MAFLLECNDKNDIQWYLKTRDLKYNKFIDNINNLNINIDYSYFSEWLSGFIEAEGCFSIRNLTNNHSFSIGQNDDIYLIKTIKEYFKVTNKVKNSNLKGRNFYLEIYKKEVLLKIINHCKKYPLLGEKHESLKKFIKELNK